MNTQILIAIFLTTISTLASAQIYKTTDEKGNPQFTDKPEPGATNATKVHLEPVNTVTPIETRPSAPATVESETSATYKTLTITSPENDGIIANGLSPTTVRVTISPALDNGHQLRLLVNGIAVGSSTSTSFVVPTLNRGTNTLQVQVLVESDAIQSSAIVTIFAYRPGG
jgi:hypothetical protein